MIDDGTVADRALVRRGLVADGAMTAGGREAREAVERATDAACRSIVEALDDDLEEAVAILRGWGAAVRAAGGYPASGPHDLAAAR